MFFVLKRLWQKGLGTASPRSLSAMAGMSSVRLAPRRRADPPGSDISGPQELPGIQHEEVPHLELVQERLPLLIRKVFGRSLHVRHLDAGSCNANEWELTALLNPVYDVQRFGIDFVASPRHADMLLVTGGVTRNLEEAVRRTYAAAASPKLVLAIGDEACGEGIIGRTYAHFGGVDQIIPVNVYVPGNPPSPAAILRGILTAVEQAGKLK